MTEAITETPTLTEVLVHHAIYQYAGVLCIAVDDFTLQNLTDDNTVRVSLEDVALLEEPGSPAWVDRMARVRKSLVSTTTNLKNENDRQTRHLEGLGEALLQEAIQRDWCSEYDEFAKEWGLPTRESEYHVTMTVRVSARNEDAAVDIVMNKVCIDYLTEGVMDNPEFQAEGVDY